MKWNIKYLQSMITPRKTIKLYQKKSESGSATSGVYPSKTQLLLYSSSLQFNIFEPFNLFLPRSGWFSISFTTLLFSSFVFVSFVLFTFRISYLAFWLHHNLRQQALKDPNKIHLLVRFYQFLCVVKLRITVLDVGYSLFC